MALTTKTNANIDSIASAVPAPYGPLTRVTDMNALGYVPNSDKDIAFTSNVSSTPVTMSYDEMVDVRTRDRILERAHSIRNINGEFQRVLDVLRVINGYTSGYTLPHTDAERRFVIDLLRTIRDIVGQPPNFIDNRANVNPAGVIADFTVTDADAGGAGLAAAVVNTSIGGFAWLWDWGDGTVSTGQNPSNHTYGSSGSKTVTLTVVGYAGTAKMVKTVTMA